MGRGSSVVGCTGAHHTYDPGSERVDAFSREIYHVLSKFVYVIPSGLRTGVSLLYVKGDGVVALS